MERLKFSTGAWSAFVGSECNIYQSFPGPSEYDSAVKGGALTDRIQVLTQEIYLKGSYCWLNLNVKWAKFEGKSA